MTQKDIELIINAIDFYNLNHFKGKETKKQLNKAKAKVQALNILGVSGMFSFEKLEQAYKDGVRDALEKGYGTFDEENYL